MYRETTDVVRGLQQQLAKQRLCAGPEYEEGPHSAIKEDEFFDAVETALDKQERELDQRLGASSSPGHPHVHNAKDSNSSMKSQQLGLISPAQADDIWEEIEQVGALCCMETVDSLSRDWLLIPRCRLQVTTEQFKYAFLGVGEGGWQLFNEDGEMKMYKREEEKDGLVVDPLKAQHCVRGFTAHEMCHYFFSPDVRMEWECKISRTLPLFSFDVCAHIGSIVVTVDNMKVVEKLRDDTLIFHQIHKRVWPAAQRDALFWSHIRKGDLSGSENKENSNNSADDNSKLVPVNSWIVCNHSVDVPPVPVCCSFSHVLFNLAFMCCLFSRRGNVYGSC